MVAALRFRYMSQTPIPSTFDVNLNYGTPLTGSLASLNVNGSDFKT